MLLNYLIKIYIITKAHLLPCVKAMLYHKTSISLSTV